MTLQVVIHGIPLRTPRSSRPRRQGLQRFRAVFARHVLRLAPSSITHLEADRSDPNWGQDLGLWVGAIQVSQIPERQINQERCNSQLPGQDLRLSSLPAVDFVALREGHRVRQIFAQNQIRTRSPQSDLPTFRSRSPRRHRIAQEIPSCTYQEIAG